MIYVYNVEPTPWWGWLIIGGIILRVRLFHLLDDEAYVMAMKYKWLSTAISVRIEDAPKYPWLKPFKWEWSVHYYRAENYRSTAPDWKPRMIVCQNRAEARVYRNAFNSNPHMDKKKAVIKRRLVQANWEDYNDSFGWKSGSGKR